jgi:ABC-type Zn uptake system ZnuABC Zn-binding protein ZnuA/ABC-type Mn2+/Zn2+ transport system permease subunit
MLDPFELPYVQDGLVEVLLLAVVAGLLGGFVVLRGLAFHVHAVGTATFPGLVLADGLGFAAALGGFGAALAFAAASVAIGRSRRTSPDSVTALVLVACLAAGVILASDVFGSGANIETLLFGSLLLIDSGDLALAAAAALLAVVGAGVAGPRWLARGFDPASAGSLGAGSRALDALLLVSLALAATAALTAVGALLVTAILVVPAATVRLLTRRLLLLQLGTMALAAAEGVFGVWLSVQTDAPPGATIAVVAGAVFCLVAVAQRARRPGAIAAAAALVALAGCGSPDDGDGTLKVVATTPQVADLVRAVGDGRVEIDQIIEPETDPHDYEPRPSDVEATAQASVVFRSGGELDEWSGDLIEDSGSEAELVSLDRGLPVRLAGEEGGGEPDPHWWHDPRNAAAAVREIEATLGEVAPDSRRLFRRRATAYVDRLDRVDAAIAACVAAIPADDRKLITDHDALGYYADRYGLEVVGTVIPALTTEAQPSAGELADLAALVRQEGVPAVFPAAGVPDDLADALADDAGAEVGDELYSDSLGPEGSAGATYLGMLEANTDAIVRGLTAGRRGCEIPGAGR